MDWIDQNLDAYRVIAEILTDLRPLVRERLEERFGKEWFRDGIPEEIFDHLIRNKEQEASIDWYENRYQEVITYAVFPDLFEIISANPDLFGPILKLAPSPSLLNTRFLELEVMRSKIGRARQVSEAEINFLTSFHLRFRRAVMALRGDEEEANGYYTPTDLPEAEPALPEPPPPDSAPEPADEPPREGVTGAAGEPEAVSAASSEPAPAKPDGPARPPQRLTRPEQATTDDDAAPGPDAQGDQSPESADAAEARPRETTATILNRAMEADDHQTVLRELYREVTGIAEVIWTTDQVPTNAVWDRVSSNSWYEANFSKLELRPLSDFSELINQVRENHKKGYTKAEIQSFLNDSRFATVLLSLRDMFQKSNI
jgi:hypothetical protein